MLHVLCSNVVTADKIGLVRVLIPALSCHALYADILTKVLAKAGCPDLMLPSTTPLQYKWYFFFENGGTLTARRDCFLIAAVIRIA